MRVRLTRPWPVIIAFSAVAVLVITAADITFPLRPWLAFWFFLVCPGMAFVGLLNLDDRLTELTLAIALSLALDTIIPAIMLYAGAWVPSLSLVALAGLSIIGAIFQVTVLPAHRRRVP